jgi:ribbon-helix-helix CopG family protein
MKTKTMVYLEPDQHRALKARARAEGISMAELMRRLARAHLEQARRLPAVSPAAYDDLVSLGASGRSDIGDRHDAELARALRAKHVR